MVLSSTCCVTLGKEQPPGTWKQDSYLTIDSRIAESLHQPLLRFLFLFLVFFFFLSFASAATPGGGLTIEGKSRQSLQMALFCAQSRLGGLGRTQLERGDLHRQSSVLDQGHWSAGRTPPTKEQGEARKQGELNEAVDVRAALLPEDRPGLQWGPRHVQSLWF